MRERKASEAGKRKQQNSSIHNYNFGIQNDSDLDFENEILNDSLTDFNRLTTF